MCCGREAPKVALHVASRVLCRVVAKPLGSRAQARRRRILDAARRLFVRQGIERSTVDDLLTEAGIARATFYRAFSGLEEVLEALYTEYELHVLSRLATQLEGLESADETALEAIIDSVLEQQHERAPLLRVMFREELRPGAGELWQRRRIAGQQKLIHTWWEQRTGIAADDDLILCLILLLQSVGLMMTSRARAKRMRRALLFVFSSVVSAYLEAHGQTGID